MNEHALKSSVLFQGHDESLLDKINLQGSGLRTTVYSLGGFISFLGGVPVCRVGTRRLKGSNVLDSERQNWDSG